MKSFFIALCASLPVLMHAQELEPNDSTALLNVRVLDPSGEMVADQFVTFTNNNTQKVYGGSSDESGKFSLLIPVGAKYTIRAEGFGGEENERAMEIPKTDQLITANFDLTVSSKSTNMMTLDIHFETNSAALIPGSGKALDELYEWMQTKKNVKIEIGGHTDNVGSDESNLKLSQARAEAARKYLLNKGVDPSRIVAKGYGEKKPIATNDTTEGRQKNRRTEVRITSWI